MHRIRRLLAIGLLALIPHTAMAADKDPLEVPLRQYALILAIALLGGLVSWYAKLRAGKVRGWNLQHLVGELATSAFAGLLAYWLCAWANTPAMLQAALVGVAGHMGARAISAFEDWAERRFGSALQRP